MWCIFCVVVVYECPPNSRLKMSGRLQRRHSSGKAVCPLCYSDPFAVTLVIIAAVVIIFAFFHVIRYLITCLWVMNCILGLMKINSFYLSSVMCVSECWVDIRDRFSPCRLLIDNISKVKNESVTLYTNTSLPTSTEGAGV
jgi:hypothetical protein